MILTVLLENIIVDDPVPLTILEIHVDIRHGYSFRIQESLKQEIVLHWINSCDSDTVADTAAGSRASSRSGLAAVSICPVDIIPDYQDILDESLLLDDIELLHRVIMDLFRLLFIVFRVVGISVNESFFDEFCQKLQSCLILMSLRKSVIRLLVLVEYKVNLTSVSYFLRIINSFSEFREKSPHFLLALHIILPAGVVDSVLVRYKLVLLHAQKHIMACCILWQGIMAVISDYKRNSRLFADFNDSLVRDFLLQGIVLVILHLEEIIAVAEDLIVPECDFLCPVIAYHRSSGHFTGYTG